jgi:thiamine biosynthesis protein ThiI
MNIIIIVRWSEIHIKGKNRKFFEKLLEDNIKEALKDFKLTFNKIQGRFLIENICEEYLDYIIKKLSKISGIHSISVAYKVDTQTEIIKDVVLSLAKDKTGTFKVETRRANKKFPIPSTDFSRMLGGEVLKQNNKLKVDVHNPNFTIYVDIRESGDTLIFTDFIKMMGGMPTGSAGRGILMLSGGIDSPVAGYMIAKRGMRLEAVHFHSYPYTSELAKEKVLTNIQKSLF